MIGRLRRRGLGWLLAAAVVGAVAALLAIRAASEGPPDRFVVVAAKAIPAGTVLDAQSAAGLLSRAPVPAGLRLRGLVADPAAAHGRRTVAPLASGEPLTLAALGGGPESGPRPLGAGERAVSVPLAAAGVAAATLVPGILVDAVASTGEGSAGRSRVVVEGAEVLAVEDAGLPESGIIAGAVLVRVSTKEALLLTEALNFAREVRLLVRPFAEPVGG